MQYAIFKTNKVVSGETKAALRETIRALITDLIEDIYEIEEITDVDPPEEEELPTEPAEEENASPEENEPSTEEEGTEEENPLPLPLDPDDIPELNEDEYQLPPDQISPVEDNNDLTTEDSSELTTEGIFRCYMYEDEDDNNASYFFNHSVTYDHSTIYQILMNTTNDHRLHKRIEFLCEIIEAFGLELEFMLGETAINITFKVPKYNNFKYSISVGFKAGEGGSVVLKNSVMEYINAQLDNCFDHFDRIAYTEYHEKPHNTYLKTYLHDHAHNSAKDTPCKTCTCKEGIRFC